MKQLTDAPTIADDLPPEGELTTLKPKPAPVMVPGAQGLPAIQAAPPPLAPPPVGAPAGGAPPPPVPTPPPAVPAVPPAPIPTLSGDWTPPTAAAGSAPLIASAAGGTMTPQGTKDNSFLGYQTNVGKPGTAEGTFGGYGTAILPDVGTTMKDFDTRVGDAIKNFNFDFSQINPAELQKISQMSANANGAEADQGDALRKKLYQGGQLTPTEQYFLAFQSGQAPQVYRPEYGASGASPTGWKLSQNDMNSLGGAKTLGDVRARQAPQAPAPVNAGNWTAANPAEQAAGLAAQGLPPMAPAPTVAPPSAPVGAPAGAPAPAPAPPVEGAVATPQKVAKVPTQGVGGAAGPFPGISAAPSGAFTKTPTDPNDALTSKTLDYGPLTDRFKVAQSELENVNKTEDPQFQADLRDAMRKAAAGGALGSGMLQTSLGDIVANRDVRRSGRGTSFLNNALTGSIQDAKDRANFAAGQQGFQADQQRTAFGQGVTEAQLRDSLMGSAFQRALQSLIAGSSGNPADVQLALSNIFGNQGANASGALSDLIKGKTANTGAGADSGGNTGYLQMLLDLLKQPSAAGAPPVPASAGPVVYGGQ